MIFETEQEKKAFEFICSSASDTFSRRGCNDLSKEELKIFEGLRLQREDTDDTVFTSSIKYDFDIIEWLRGTQNE